MIQPSLLPLSRYLQSDVRKDLMAGITVGIIALPLGMAFAIASGVKPEYGLYTTIIGAIIVALFGGSRYQVAGPTGAFIPLLLSVVLTYGYENLLIVGFLAGIILITLGLCKMGSLIKYIPRPVTVGFTAGIAVNIFVGQIPNFLGLTGLQRHESFYANVQEIVLHINTFNAYSLLIGIVCLAAIIQTPRYLPRIPGSLVGLVLSTLIAHLLFPDKVATIGSAIGVIPNSLPEFSLPEISREKIELLIRPAFAIAALGAIESLLSAVVADGMTGDRHDSNRELIGQGLANILCPLFGGIPATGAIARTATNIRMGAKTSISVIFSAIFVLAILLFLGPYASNIPLASMAPIMMVVAWNMSEYRQFKHIMLHSNNDNKVLLVTFLCTVFLNLTTAIEVGIILAMVIFTKRMSDMLVVTKVLPDPNSRLELAEEEIDYPACKQISIFNIEGPLFFGAAQMFSQSILGAIHYQPKVFILKMSHVPFMDLTGEQRLADVINTFHNRGVVVLLSGVSRQPKELMKRTGLYEKISDQHFFVHTDAAINYAKTLTDSCVCAKCSRKVFAECG